MLKLYLLLYYEFAKIGLLAIGGGYAALPFLFFLADKYNWFSAEELTDMIAVSNITPGPVGINMATYTGFKTAGLTGSVIATVGIVSLPFVIAIITASVFDKLKGCNAANDIFTGLKPAACALLCSTAIKLLYGSLTGFDFIPFNLHKIADYEALILFIVILIPLSLTKKNPLLAVIFGAVGGIIFKSF